MNHSFLSQNPEQEALYNFLMGPMPWTSRSAAHRTGRPMASKDACLACLLLLQLIPGLKVTVERNGLACLEVPVRPRGTPRQELKAETSSGTHEGMLLPNLLEGSHSAIFPIQPRLTCPGLALPTVGLSLLICCAICNQENALTDVLMEGFWSAVLGIRLFGFMYRSLI